MKGERWRIKGIIQKLRLKDEGLKIYEEWWRMIKNFGLSMKKISDEGGKLN